MDIFLIDQTNAQPSFYIDTNNQAGTKTEKKASPSDSDEEFDKDLFGEEGLDESTPKENLNPANNLNQNLNLQQVNPNQKNGAINKSNSNLKPLNDSKNVKTNAQGTNNLLAPDPKSNKAAVPNLIPEQPVNQNAKNPVKTAPKIPEEPATPVAEIPEELAPAPEEIIKAESLPLPNEFAGAPPVPGTRRIMAVGEAPEEYDVEKGDTLFDICDQLLDEKGYWPKLWALNPEIKNPHFIYPEMKLRFYPGNKESPPYLRVVQEEDVVPLEKGPLKEEELIAQPWKLKINEDLAPEKVKELQIVGPKDVMIPQDISDMFISGNELQLGSVMDLHAPAIIVPEKKSATGIVKAGIYAENLLKDGDQVRISEEDRKIRIGDVLSVARLVGEIYHPETEKFLGYRYDLCGTIKVTRNEGEGFFQATVTDQFNPVRPGDILLPYMSSIRRMPSNWDQAPNRDAAGVIIDFSEFRRAIGAAHEMAFISLDMGEKVTVGDVIPLYQSPALEYGEDRPDVGKLLESVGTARILEIHPNAALVMITKSSRPIRIGARATKRNIYPE